MYKEKTSMITALLSEKILSLDWEKPEEDKAWKSLQMKNNVLQKVQKLFSVS